MAQVLLKPQVSTVHMVISPVSKLTSASSPEVLIHSIPFKVEVSKDTKKNSLAVHLQCEKADGPDGMVPASATVEFLPFNCNSKSDFVEYIGPHVFTSTDNRLGIAELKGWSKYVKNDAMQLKVEVTAEDPNNADRSILKFEDVEKCCDQGSHGTFKLTVENIESLIALRSPEFKIRGQPWDLTVYKSHKCYLGIKLSNKSTEDASLCIEMAVELLSPDAVMDPIEGCADIVKKSDQLKIGKIIPWDELVDPKNGFVKNNAITLIVKVKTEKCDGDVLGAAGSGVVGSGAEAGALGANPSGASAKRRRIEYMICFDQDLLPAPKKAA